MGRRNSRNNEGGGHSTTARVSGEYARICSPTNQTQRAKGGEGMKYKAIQTIYFIYEIEADTIEDAYRKTADIEPSDCLDEVIGEWTLEEDEQ